LVAYVHWTTLTAVLASPASAAQSRATRADLNRSKEHYCAITTEINYMLPSSRECDMQELSRKVVLQHRLQTTAVLADWYPQGQLAPR
jgi:hypothetical protein